MHLGNVQTRRNRAMIMGMSGDFISRLLFSCNHQFSWSRRSESGDYYQVCVHCGTEYRYDWSKMRRVEEVSVEDPSKEGAPEEPRLGSFRLKGSQALAWALEKEAQGASNRQRIEAALRISTALVLFWPYVAVTGHYLA